MNMVIYGAQSIALGAYNAIKELCPEKEILCFLVTEKGNNPLYLAGLPVYVLAEWSEQMNVADKEAIEVLIATPESVMDAIESLLNQAGFCHYVRLDSMRWADMMERSFISNKKFTPVSAYPIGCNKQNVQVFMTKFWKDKVLTSGNKAPDYFIPVQAGAALTEQRVAENLDNTGDNISEKNRNYSELTVLYWMWKNRILTDENKNSNYYGLAHYRRYLELSEDDFTRIKNNAIDVILPYPMPCEPNIEVHHNRYLSKEEWNAVLQALKELQPEYAEGFKDILLQEYMFNYNIIVARGDVLVDYCEWLFPILKRVEEINDPNGIKEPNRYIGYIGESLETLYFLYNKDKLRIAHSACRFLV